MPETLIAPPTTTPISRRVAVGSLVAWGLLHVIGGVALVVAGAGSARDAMSAYATGLTIEEVGGDAGAAITGLVGFHGFNIAAAGVAVTALAWAVRRRRHGGLGPALTIAAVADAGLVGFLLAPGVMSVADGTPGIVLLAVAVAADRRSRATDAGPPVAGH